MVKPDLSTQNRVPLSDKNQTLFPLLFFSSRFPYLILFYFFKFECNTFVKVLNFDKGDLLKTTCFVLL